MSEPRHFQTNYEGGLTLDQLAQSTGCTLEQFLGDSVLSIMLCVSVVQNNRDAGKLTPTCLLFEHESGQGFETVDVMEALNSPLDPQRRVESDFPVIDPVAEDQTITYLPLADEMLAVLDSLSSQTDVPRRKLLEEGINLRWMLKLAADKSLEVLLEGADDDEYIIVPTSFVE